MEVIALFDGDIIAYRAGFAAEKSYYYDFRQPPEEGGRVWPYKSDVPKTFPREHLGKGKNLEPLENALQNAKSLINNSLEDIHRYFSSDVPQGQVSLEYQTFLSGNKEETNFRKKVDKTYKGNRKTSHKPTYLGDLHEYLLKYHNAYETEGCEADDFFGHACKDAEKEGKTAVIVSVDKDLKQIEGLHYNPVKQLFHQVTETEAQAFFWRQMLQGDAADNIIGISGIGEKKAARYIPNGTTNEKAKEFVIKYYEKEFENWRERFNKNADLLWIWRKIPDECPFKVEEGQESFDSPVQ